MFAFHQKDRSPLISLCSFHFIATVKYSLFLRQYFLKSKYWIFYFFIYLKIAHTIKAQQAKTTKIGVMV
jgi:hypothetical protein